MEFDSVIPILRIFDETKAREFYVGYLGFDIAFEARFHEGAPLFMGVHRGHALLYLSEHHGDGAPGSHVCIEMRGVRELHAELAAKHYKYMNPSIVEQEWGTREFTVYDPFNNHITFREPLESSREAREALRG
jgi:catechol 2,3-dioxygenase-like lactoylglutathione lyase family enzyme